MRWMLYVAAALVAVVILVAVVGAMLPKKHAASRTVNVTLPPDALYTLLSDVSAFRSWRPDLKSLERRPDKDGMPAWIEESSGGRMPMRFERMERPSLLVGRIDSTELPFGGTWTYRIAPAPNGSELTITEDGEVSNVIFRFMSRFVFGHYASIDAYLKNVRTKAAAGK
jgi:hypothetical protein